MFFYLVFPQWYSDELLKQAVQRRCEQCFIYLVFPHNSLVNFKGKLSKEEVSNVFPLNTLVNFKNKLSKDEVSNVFPQRYFGEVQAVIRRGEQCFLPCFSPMVLW